MAIDVMFDIKSDESEQIEPTYQKPDQEVAFVSADSQIATTSVPKIGEIMLPQNLKSNSEESKDSSGYVVEEIDYSDQGMRLVGPFDTVEKSTIETTDILVTETTVSSKIGSTTLPTITISQEG